MTANRTRPACSGRCGRHSGQRVLTLQCAMPMEMDFKQTLNADINGFSLHADARCGADDRQALEHNAKLRALVVPQSPKPAIQELMPSACEPNCAHHRPVRLSWTKLLKWVLDLTCSTTRTVAVS